MVRGCFRCRFLSQFFGVLIVTVLSGCGQSEPARFRLNMVEMVRSNVSQKHQQEIADILTAMFGTPDDPYAPEGTGLNLAKLRLAAGPVASDKYGAAQGLYREHCAHCHGISGDGMGPTAAYLHPYPRDYRLGKFKAKSTYLSAKPTDEDLKQILVNGIPGTAMPSFMLLPESEIAALVEYVKYLAIRGETESLLVQKILEVSEDDPETEMDENSLVAYFETQEDIIEDVLVGMVMFTWDDAANQIIQPTEPGIVFQGADEDDAEASLRQSVAVGRELFHSKAKGNCMQCHGTLALGDGQTTDFDDWTKPINEILASDELRPKLPETAALPPQNIHPRNLRQGIYRFGRRPLDIFRRISAGIAGTPMPGVGPPTPGATGTLTDEEIWHVVNYVQSLPYDPLSQPATVTTTEIQRDRL